MLATFPAGLLIYRAWNNTLSVTQQSIIMKKHSAKIELFDNIKAVFGKKKSAGDEDAGPRRQGYPTYRRHGPRYRKARA